MNQFENETVDGFNILPPVLPGSLGHFIDLVIPELTNPHRQCLSDGGTLTV
ncbi:hypothetical protein [Rhodoferax lithotrophicus]|uniref:hypothetical protein n=1 Tax=Rhodoferax lithotrophicus TaxID=2798804 RepID=UPI001CC7B6CC|nr:hypothetical protein [Rhodoferax sp. MIZ03]